MSSQFDKIEAVVRGTRLEARASFSQLIARQSGRVQAAPTVVQPKDLDEPLSIPDRIEVDWLAQQRREALLQQQAEQTQVNPQRLSPFAAAIAKAAMPSRPATESREVQSVQSVAAPRLVDPEDVNEPQGPMIISRRSMLSNPPASPAVAPSSSEASSYVDPDAPMTISRSSMVAKRPAKPAVPHSDEQRAVIECQDQHIVADAFAGCGKTTTAVGYAAFRPKERMLYICLNRANADEARLRFGPNVDAQTTHQMAWKVMRNQVGNRINRRWKPLLVRDQLMLPTPKMAAVTMRILQSFWGSSDVEISEKHAEEVRIERQLDPSEVINGIAYARLGWKRMMDPTDTVEMPDDAYLKMYALRSPQLNYDAIIFDEAQDANPVTAQIIKDQKKAKILCIGDRHQSIYQFRGSVNAMEEFSANSTCLHLSQTWRFGPKIAGLANLLLKEFKGETVPIQGMAADGQWDSRRFTTLARTNAELFRLAAGRRGEGVHWVGGPEGYRLDLVMDVYNLFARNRSEIKDVSLRKFDRFEDYKNYAEDAADGEAMVLASVVEEFTNDIPDVIDQIKRNAVPKEADADRVFTTGHRAKGLEWNCVQLAEDFAVLEPLEAKLAVNPDEALPIQDINLLYVTLTRAKHALDLNPDTRDWISRLQAHRENREAAKNRQAMQLRRSTQGAI